MKAILEFDLDNADDEMALKRAIKSTDMACFIFELKHNFWRKYKHDESDFNVENYREALGRLLEEHNINVEDLLE